MKKETYKKSIYKTITWRIIATTTTMTLIWIFTGELILSAGVGALEVITKIILYYFHERAWIKFNENTCIT